MRSLYALLALVGMFTTAGHATTSPDQARPIPMAERCMFDGAFNATFGPDSHPSFGDGFPTLTHAIYAPGGVDDPPDLIGFAVATFGPSTVSVSFTTSGTFTGDPLYNAMYFSTLNVVDPPPHGDAPYGGLVIVGIDSQTNMAGFTAANLYHPTVDGSPGLPDIEVGGLSYDTNSRIVLDVALVPAPGSLAAVLIGGLALLAVRRRGQPI